MVKFSLTRDGEKAEWSHTCKPLGKKTAMQVAEDFARDVDRRLDHIRNGDLPIPPDALESRKTLKAFVMGVDYRLPAKAQSGSIQKLYDDYLAKRSEVVRTGRINTDLFDYNRTRVSNFLAYCKKRKKASLSAVVTADFLENYRTHQLDLVEERNEKGKPHGTSPYDAKHRLNALKAMLRWAYDKHQIEVLPRNLLNKEFADIALPKPKPKFFTVKQVEKLYKAANEQQRLWILLALNCGYLQSDIATLEHDMVNWKTGIIGRDRWPAPQNLRHVL